MMYLSDLNALIQHWKTMIPNGTPTDDYSWAVYNCIEDVNSIIDKTVEEEVQAQALFEMRDIEES